MDMDNSCLPGAQMQSMPQLAMVYSPVQPYRQLYGRDEALMRGTLFIELDKPLVEDCK